MEQDHDDNEALEASVGHEYTYSHLDFNFACPACGEGMSLSNPWQDCQCRCGRTWRLHVKAVGTK